MYLLTKISSAHLSYYMLCFSSLKCPSNDMVPPLCRIIAPTKREKKMWPNFLQFYLGFFSRSKCFLRAAALGIFLSPQSVVIVSSLHYNVIITKAHQMANLLTYMSSRPWAWEQRTCLTF